MFVHTIKLIKRFALPIAFILIIVGLISFLVINYYLAQEKLWFYSTGSDVIAIENTTWLMSEKEVVRTNRVGFLRDTMIYRDKPKYIKERTKNDVIFNNYRFQVKYIFYKDQLVRCSLFSKEDSDRRDVKKDSAMVRYLRKLYDGKFYGGIDSSHTFCIIDSKDVRVEYNSYIQPVIAMTLNEGCKWIEFVSYSISLTYKPFTDILDIVYKHLQ